MTALPLSRREQTALRALGWPLVRTRGKRPPFVDERTVLELGTDVTVADGGAMVCVADMV
ncbi:MAG: hypothetical protein ABEJ70_07965 [Halobacteriaceae archaeon]